MSTPANALDITQSGLVKFDGVSNFTGVTTTNHYVLVGAASNGVTNVTPSTAGKVLTSNGTSSDPSFETVSNSILPGSGQITLSNGTNISVSGSPVALGGTATINVSGPASATTLTSNGVVYGQGSSAVAATSAGTTNTVLLGNTGSAPSFGAVPNAALANSSVTLSNGNNITVTGSPLSLGGTATIAVSGTTNHAIQLGNASGSLTSASALTNGQLLIGVTGSDPVAATLTAGSGISISNSTGSITISATGGSVVPALTYITTSTVSSGPVAFTSLSSTYKGYRYYLVDVSVTSTDRVIIQCSTNNGSSYDSGNNYSYTTSTGSGNADVNGISIMGTGSITAQTLSGYVDVYFNNTANAIVTASFAITHSSASFEGTGTYNVKSNVDAIRFTVAGANNLSAGTIIQYGIS